MYPSKVSSSFRFTPPPGDEMVAEPTAVVSWYTLTMAPFSVRKCAAALPALMSALYSWKQSAGDDPGAVPVDMARVLFAEVPNVVCAIPRFPDDIIVETVEELPNVVVFDPFPLP